MRSAARFLFLDACGPHPLNLFSRAELLRLVDDRIMPTLPLSVMNVIDGMRGTQGMVVVGESAVNEASAAVDYVVSGSQVITLTIK